MTLNEVTPTATLLPTQTLPTFSILSSGVMVSLYELFTEPEERLFPDVNALRRELERRTVCLTDGDLMSLYQLSPVCCCRDWADCTCGYRKTEVIVNGRTLDDAWLNALDQFDEKRIYSMYLVTNGDGAIELPQSVIR